jgi:hypothetical protein
MMLYLKIHRFLRDGCKYDFTTIKVGLFIPGTVIQLWE